MGQRELSRVRRIALALPEVNERVSHGETCFFVRGKRALCYLHDDHYGEGRISLCALFRPISKRSWSQPNRNASPSPRPRREACSPDG